MTIQAINNTTDHLKSFWEARMRRIAAHLPDKAAAGFSHIALEAAEVMVAKDVAARISA